MLSPVELFYPSIKFPNLRERMMIDGDDDGDDLNCNGMNLKLGSGGFEM